MNPRSTAEVTTLQAEGNQNMIRCWGGGVYEPGRPRCDQITLCSKLARSHKTRQTLSMMRVTVLA
jgi:hypothetical protein